MDSNAPVQYAGFWMRFLAQLIDGCILGAGMGIIFFIFAIILAITGIVKTDSSDVGAAALVAGLYLVAIGVSMLLQLVYFAAFESSNSMGTPGKMALGLIVTDMEGNRITFGRSAGRNLGKVLSGMIMYIGYMMAGFTEKKQALHDLMANCLVIKKPQ